jgi:mannose-6-phosphate isomerase-like protein (cupin superfamily)
MTTLAERSLGGRDAVKVVPVGCTGRSSARLIVLREGLRPASHEDADEHLYLLAGEATLTLGEKQQALAPGWFALVPRETKFGIVPKGRNPALLLSVLSGPPCAAAAEESR